MSDKIPVAILGATGTVGQKFVRLLETTHGSRSSLSPPLHPARGAGTLRQHGGVSRSRCRHAWAT